MAHAHLDPAALPWITRPREAGEPARHVAELSDDGGFAGARANERETAELLPSAV